MRTLTPAEQPTKRLPFYDSCWPREQKVDDRADKKALDSCQAVIEPSSCTLSSVVAIPDNRQIMTGSSASSSSGNVRVCARIRPLSVRETESGSKHVVTHLQQQQFHDDDAPALVQVQTGEKRWFELDAVFGGDSTQVDVYQQSGAQKAVTADLFAGFNCTILAYGQTGAGKTHTMGTASTHSEEITARDGIIPRACADLFCTIADKCDGNANAG